MASKKGRSQKPPELESMTYEEAVCLDVVHELCARMMTSVEGEAIPDVRKALALATAFTLSSLDRAQAYKRLADFAAGVLMILEDKDAQR